MRKHILNRRWVGLFALWVIVLSACPMNVWAMPSASMEVMSNAGINREAYVGQVLSIFENPQAQVHLMRMGLNTTELEAKLATLSDTQLVQLAERAETVKAGAGAAGVAIVVLVILLLVLAWLYATNRSIEIKDRAV